VSTATLEDGRQFAEHAKLIARISDLGGGGWSES